MYVHFPFCVHKCGFCDFYSGVFPYQGDYFLSVVKELELYKQERDFSSYYFDSLYFGGGTPSLIKEQDLEYFFNFLYTHNFLKSLKEITIELNPEDVNIEKLKFYKSLGINRVSLGVESLDAKVLKILERRANLVKTIDSIGLVASEFSNYSLDFMYSIPGQDICSELFSFSSFAPPHLSAYSLTLYPGTRFFIHKEQYTVPDEEMVENYENVHNFFIQLGYNHYEVSNFAKDGKESLHNQHYWNQDHYIGLGAGASGYLNNVRYTNSQLKAYLNYMSEGKKPIEEQEEINPKSQFIDMLILRLRTKNKILLEDYFKYIPEKKVKELEFFFLDMDTKKYIIYDKLERSIIPNFRTWLYSDAFSEMVYNILY